MNNWTGKRVLILGAARQGLALARWLAHHGARDDAVAFCQWATRITGRKVQLRLVDAA